MKAMLWKELRENFKWALLAMVGLALAEIYGLFYTDPNDYYNNRSITLCSPTFLMATSFGNAIVGLVLGFVQILPEQRRDQWAALLHRPVSRAVIFRGKAVAGLLLYLFATVPPFLICWYLAATPGHFMAPYVPELILPGISDLCIGSAYYFAALVVALQRGSWFGPRIFALLAAVYVSANVSADKYFYVAVEAGVIMAFILFTTAWGAMLSNGKFQDRPWLARWTLLATVFYGACGLGMLGTILLAAGRQIQPYIGSQYHITQDGQPIVTTTNKDLITTVTDLAGNAIHDDRYTGNRSYENEINMGELTYYIKDDHGYNPSGLYFNYRQVHNYVQSINLNGEFTNPIQWFELKGLNFSVGIDRRKKAVTEIADRTGFHPAGETIVPFTGTKSEWYGVPSLIQEGTDAFAYNLEKETRAPLPSADTSPIYGFGLQSYQPQGGKGYDTLSIVGREQGIQVYDSKSAPIVSIPYDSQINLDRWGTIQFGPNNSLTRYYMIYAPSAWIPWAERSHMPQYLSELDEKGALLHSYTLPPLPGIWYPQTWQSYISNGLMTPAFWFWTLAYQKIGAAVGIEHLKDDANWSNPDRWNYVHGISIQIIEFTTPCALIALLWARRRGMTWPRVWAWTAFVFAFNLAGLITFRLVADWPVSVPCHKCGRPRLVEETACPHCQAGWPLPELRGSEIFDDRTPAAVAALN